MRNRWQAVLPAGIVAVAVLLMASCVVADRKGRAPSGQRVTRVLQYNLCGASADCPWNGGRSGPGTSVARLVEEVVRLRPDLATVNEICLTQYTWLKEQLVRSGWLMDGTYASSLDNVPACGETGRFGSAVLSRGDVPDGRQDYRRFTHTGGEVYTNGGRTVSVRRGLLCGHTRLDGQQIIACTAHAFAQAPEQLCEIRDRINEFPSAVPVVLGGDLNIPPGTPHLSCLTGRFTEADEGRAEPTADGRKIDYVFATRHHFAVQGVHVRKYPESDHAMLQGVFTLVTAG
ncbi:endonuclease/exonuclease/phosphatase family protein [Streptomyces sp. NPDC002250]|uniref:endonuclease/exonuclease/phosphatase family protein n=1 Tax=Streptomyces sp. NPDC002250 TaxID=3364641 RepID=UPI003697F2C4